ncbi:MAG: prolipoprotein diacylglyceryl transferase [Planctomycetota bacterium]|jgi:phosphatidylglycerol:prolipoprotein diacylglycerol transferase
MYPVLFEIPGLGWPVSAYQTFLTLGLGLAIWFAFQLAKRFPGVDPDHILDMAIWTVVSGILGARVFYFIEFHEKHFADSPWYEVFYVHQGGYVFYGGFLGAAGTLALYLIYRKWQARNRPGEVVNIIRTLDTAAVAVPVGLGIGRIGCFLNGCCWGLVDQGHALLPIHFPRGSYAFDLHVRGRLLDAGASESLAVHATQLYSITTAFLVCGLLLVLWRFHRRDGQISALLFMIYGPVRFTIETFRHHDSVAEITTVFGIAFTNSQLVAIATVLFGLTWFILASFWGSPYPGPEGTGGDGRPASGEPPAAASPNAATA